MVKQSFKQFILFLFIGLSVVLSGNAIARDISAEQHAASSARDAYNQAKSDAANNALNLSAQERRIFEEQTRLKQLQDNQAAGNTKLEIAKANLELTEKSLEQVWDERNK